MLGNPIYRGIVTYARSRGAKKGGSARRRLTIPEAEWEVAGTFEDLRIVDDRLWLAVAARREATRNLYIRTAAGKLQAKPEGVSAATAHVLTGGIARCGRCGGSLSAHNRRVYRCSKRAHGKPCTNATAVPLAEFEAAVLDSLRAALLDNQDVTADLMVAKIAEVRTAHETRLAAWHAEHRDPSAEIAKLTAEVAHLVNLAASGSTSVLAGIKEREARIEELKAREVPTMPAWLTFDRAEFLEGLRTVGGTWSSAALTRDSAPLASRQVLRKFGVTEITVTPTAEGWTASGALDFASILKGSGPGPDGEEGGPSRPPM